MMPAVAHISDAESAFLVGRELLEARDAASALACFRHAAALGYNADACSGESWFCHMLLGQFENAWLESDAISRRGAPDQNVWWDRKPVTSGALMIRCLRGMGDTIQFIRYVRLLRPRVVRLMVSAPQPLVTLLETLPEIDEVCAWSSNQTEPHFDQQIEVTELPRVLRTVVETIPGDVPYLYLPRPAKAHSRAVKVGLVWTASTWNPVRSIPIEQIRQLCVVPGVEFGTLQFGAECIGERLTEAGAPVLETAQAIAAVDLVITVDTMAAHLAGALAKPVWILLPFAADWRWMLNGTSSPWYPTAQLFRQPRPGEWQPVIEKVASALADFVSR